MKKTEKKQPQKFNFYKKAEEYKPFLRERSCTNCTRNESCLAIVGKDWSMLWLDYAKCGCMLYDNAEILAKDKETRHILIGDAATKLAACNMSTAAAMAAMHSLTESVAKIAEAILDTADADGNEDPDRMLAAVRTFRATRNMLSLCNAEIKRLSKAIIGTEKAIDAAMEAMHEIAKFAQQDRKAEEEDEAEEEE